MESAGKIQELSQERAQFVSKIDRLEQEPGSLQGSRR